MYNIWNINIGGIMHIYVCRIVYCYVKCVMNWNICCIMYVYI